MSSLAEMLFGKPPSREREAAWRTVTAQAREIEQLEVALAVKDSEIKRLNRALEQIAEQETPGSNATARRMAQIAVKALVGQTE